MAQKAKNPVETYNEFSSDNETADEPPIDSLPNKDWLRA